MAGQCFSPGPKGGVGIWVGRTHGVEARKDARKFTDLSMSFSSQRESEWILWCGPRRFRICYVAPLRSVQLGRCMNLFAAMGNRVLPSPEREPPVLLNSARALLLEAEACNPVGTHVSDLTASLAPWG